MKDNTAVFKQTPISSLNFKPKIGVENIATYYNQGQVVGIIQNFAV